MAGIPPTHGQNGAKRRLSAHENSSVFAGNFMDSTARMAASSRSRGSADKIVGMNVFARVYGHI